VKEILSGLSLAEIENITESLKASKFRARQIHNWIYLKSVSSIDEMTDKNLYDFLCEDITWITFLFYSILDCLFTLAIIFVTIFSVFLIPITLFVLIYKSYIYFLNLTILFKCLGSFGIFDTIFIILPSYLIMLIIYLIFACFIMRKSVSFKKCGISLYDNSVNELKKLLIILICGCILVSLYEIIMLSIFCNKFIIS